MFKNKEQILKEREFVENNFDEEDDIYLPDNIFGEIRFICFMLWYICKHPKERNIELINLKRQIGIYKFWQKNEWENNKLRIWIYKLRMKYK